MRRSLGGLTACLLVAACSGATTEATLSSTSAPSSTTTTIATTTTTAPTTTTTVIGAGLLEGRLMAAWNRGDLQEYISFFSTDALWNGLRPDTVELAAWHDYLQSTGWRIMAADCERRSETHVTCRTTYTDDIVGPAGYEAVAESDYWLDDADLITSYSTDAMSWTVGVEAFTDAFDEWLGGAYPDIAGQWMVDDGYPSPGICAEVVTYVGEFLTLHPEYRAGADPVVPDPVLTGLVDSVEVYNADARQTALVSWAMTRFAAVGLEPPPVTAVSFPPTKACRLDFSGVTIHAGEGSAIDVCVEREELAIALGFPLTARRTILHELGHVWSADVATEASRREFMDLRGVAEWIGATWQECGSEQAAEIIMWGVMDENVLPRVPNATCAELSSAFEALTGVIPSQRLADCSDEPLDYGGSS